MKRKRSISMLSFWLTVMLILQTLTYAVPATASTTTDLTAEEYAESESANIDNTEETSTDGATLDETNATVTQDSAIVTLPVVAPMSLGPTDKTSIFVGSNSFPLVVQQDNAIVNQGEEIQGRKNFTLKLENLKIPVRGDDPNPTEADLSLYITKGDWIELKREDYFKDVILSAGTRNLTAQTQTGPKQIATVQFSVNSIKITFNGDDQFFNGIGRDVKLSFETTATADVDGMGYGETKPITIFGSVYQLKNPDVTPAYEITLTADNAPKTPTWTWWYPNLQAYRDGYLKFHSVASSFDKLDKTHKLDVDGTIFYTKPSDYRMVYVPGTFKVNGVVVTPHVDTDGSLSYKFPAGTGIDPKIEYEAWFHKDMYYKEYRDKGMDPGRDSGTQKFVPTVRLQDDSSTVLANATREMWTAPDWIQASGSYDHANEMITWIIDVNHYNKKGLKDLTITNVLPAGLDFESATWQTWVDGSATAATDITPDVNGSYSFGDIDGKVQLVIKSKVITGSDFQITPRANWNLETPNGIQNNDVTSGSRPNAVTDEARVLIGAHTFAKSGSVTMEDYNRGAITWTVGVKPQYALPDAVMYDVLIHGGDLNILDNAVDATGEVSAETIAAIRSRINDAQLWKQYDPGTLQSAHNLDVKHIPLTVNGEVVADLIRATGYNSDQLAQFTFRALETNPDFLFKQDFNDGKARWNRALFFDNGKFIKEVQNSINLHYRMLNKDMLTASYPIRENGTLDTWYTPNNIHRYVGYDGTSAGDEYAIAGYDRVTRTVTFRLSINMPGFKTEELSIDGENRVVSDIKLVDTLPKDWEFVPFENGQYYELYKGYSDNGNGTSFGTRNNAQELIAPDNAAHVVTNFEHSGETGTFTFSKFESPYVILVKAKPTTETLERYLDEYLTDTSKVRQTLYNQASLSMKWNGVEKTVTEQRKVIVSTQTLGKSVTKPSPGVLEWTVNYTPPFEVEDHVYLEDTISAGMNLRHDANGKLVLTNPSMAVYRANLTSSGALEQVGGAINLNDPNAEVKVEANKNVDGSTTLTFKMDNPNQYYQFVYQTEVDSQSAKAGDKMSNEVKLAGDSTIAAVSAKSEIMLDGNDVAGSAGINALLPITKVDPDGKPLQGVCFTLYKKGDPLVEVAKGTTDANGKLNMLFPDPGDYELHETCIDENTYLPNPKIYEVYVGDTLGKPVWVDGQLVSTDKPLIVPTRATGGLIVSNEVTGNGGEPNKEFVYTITFDGEDPTEEYKYTKDGQEFKIKSGESIILKHNEKITFPKLLEGLSYTVTQQDYTDDGYTTSPNTLVYSGAVEKDKVKELAFVNNRIISGNLLIDNTVTGAGDQNKNFEYTINFTGTGASESYEYTKSDGTTGTVTSGGKILLKHGQSATIQSLPVGLTYTVEQTDYANEDYTTEPNSLKFTGPIEEAKTAEAKFVNHKDAPGGLVVSNTVIGNGSDSNKDFEYKVIFTGPGANRTYNYTKSEGTTGTIKSGDTFTLKHGEKITIEGIIKDTDYVVIEEDYTSEYYTTNPISREHTGTIEVGTIAEAPFENARYLPGTLALEPKEQKVRGNGEVPVDLTATLTGEDGRPVEGEEITFIVDGVEVGKAITDENGKATITYQPPKLTEETPKEHNVVATTKATSPSGQPYNEDDATAKVITMPAALTGVLRDNETGLVIPNAEIQVKNVKTGEVTIIKTDEEGRYYHLVQRDEEYTITYNRTIMINGVPTSIPFTQKAFIEDKDAAPVEGNLIPAEITAVGIVLLQQPNGSKSLLNEAFAGKLHIYLKDASGNYVSENGVPKAFPVEDNGTFLAEGLTTGTYMMEVRYEFEPGKELTLFKDKALNLAANGELNISEELVDPYGTVYDETTGDANTGKKIEGATVTLYYADTPRNRAKGITPGTKVVLPAIPGFAPNDNASPEQLSDLYGFYAYMVFPEADYYLVVTKEGYETYTSPTISVEWDIVRHDVPMKPISSGGNPGGNPDPGTNPGNPGGNPNPGTNPSKPDVEETPEQPEGTPDSEETTEEPEGNPDTEEITEQPESNPGSGETTEESVEQPEANEQQENNQPQKNNEAKQENKLDNVPKTGDDSLSPLFYMALALMSSIMLGFLLLSGRKKKHI